MGTSCARTVQGQLALAMQMTVADMDCFKYAKKRLVLPSTYTGTSGCSFSCIDRERCLQKKKSVYSAGGSL